MKCLSEEFGAIEKRIYLGNWFLKMKTPSRKGPPIPRQPGAKVCLFFRRAGDLNFIGL